MHAFPIRCRPVLMALLMLAGGLLQGCESPALVEHRVAPPAPRTPPARSGAEACADARKARFVRNAVRPVQIRAGEELAHQVSIAFCDGTGARAGTLTRRLIWNGTPVKESVAELRKPRSGPWQDQRYIALPAAAPAGTYRLESVFDYGQGTLRETVDFKVVASGRP